MVRSSKLYQLPREVELQDLECLVKVCIANAHSLTENGAGSLRHVAFATECLHNLHFAVQSLEHMKFCAYCRHFLSTRE